MTALDQFADVVGPAACLTDPNDIEPYSLDWRGNFNARPTAVVKPASTNEVAGVLRAAAAAGTGRSACAGTLRFRRSRTG